MGNKQTNPWKKVDMPINRIWLGSIVNLNCFEVIIASRVFTDDEETSDHPSGIYKYNSISKTLSLISTYPDDWAEMAEYRGYIQNIVHIKSSNLLYIWTMNPRNCQLVIFDINTNQFIRDGIPYSKSSAGSMIYVPNAEEIHLFCSYTKMHSIYNIKTKEMNVIELENKIGSFYGIFSVNYIPSKNVLLILISPSTGNYANVFEYCLKSGKYARINQMECSQNVTHGLVTMDEKHLIIPPEYVSKDDNIIFMSLIYNNVYQKIKTPKHSNSGWRKFFLTADPSSQMIVYGYVRSTMIGYRMEMLPEDLISVISQFYRIEILNCVTCASDITKSNVNQFNQLRLINY